MTNKKSSAKKTEVEEKEQKQKSEYIIITNSYIKRVTTRFPDMENLLFTDPIVTEVRKMEYPFRVQLKISRIWDYIDVEGQRLETQRINLIKKFAETDNDGNPKVLKDKNKYEFKEDNESKFNEEWLKLLIDVVELPIKRIKIDPEDMKEMPKLSDEKMQILLPLLADFDID